VLPQPNFKSRRVVQLLDGSLGPEQPGACIKTREESSSIQSPDDEHGTTCSAVATHAKWLVGGLGDSTLEVSAPDGSSFVTR
jgi:hypothetical protein